MQLSRKNYETGKEIGKGDPYSLGFLVAQLIRSLSAMIETQARSLSRENPLEKEMATHSCNLAWRIPRTEEPGGLQFIGSQTVGHD